MEDRPIRDVEIMSEETVRELLPLPVAVDALADAERRKQNGETPVFYYSRSERAIFVMDAGK